MQIFIARNGQRLGPYPIEEVNRQLASGTISATDQAWYEGAAGWAPLSTVPGVTLPGSAGVTAATSSVPAAGAGRPVPNYLVQAILVTIFCCLPLGIPAIVFAAQVNGKLAAGDMAGALDSSAKARKWTWIAFWVGLVGIIGWTIVNFAIIGAGVAGAGSN